MNMLRFAPRSSSHRRRNTADFDQHLLDDVEAFVHMGIGRGQGGQQADGVAVDAAGGEDKALLQGLVGDGFGQLRCRRVATAIMVAAVPINVMCS